MCGRVTLLSDYDELVDELDVAYDPNQAAAWQPRYNVAPTQWHWIVQWMPRSAERVMVPARWGLINAWSKDRKWAARQINARAEGVEDKPAYREAFALRRCVVPISGFYEWAGDGERSIPHYIRPQAQAILPLAGLWASWIAPESGETEQTFTILTTAANETMAPLHERMPVILDREGIASWLEPDAAVADLRQLLRPAPEGLLRHHPVSARINTAEPDDADLIEEVTLQPPRQQSLF